LFNSAVHLESRAILEQILSGEEAEMVVEHIHEYLTAIGQNVRNGTVNLDDFVIFKVRIMSLSHVAWLIYLIQRLGKNPEDYPDVKSQPHVQVALRLKAAGRSAKSGDVVSYIFCLAEGEVSSKTAQADRAYHPDEIRRSGGKLKIGQPWQFQTTPGFSY
jgi:DNA polymerase alpha subunit A